MNLYFENGNIVSVTYTYVCALWYNVYAVVRSYVLRICAVIRSYVHTHMCTGAVMLWSSDVVIQMMKLSKQDFIHTNYINAIGLDYIF